MCVIISVDSARKKVDSDTLQKAWESNSDGAGVAWRHKGKVCVIKGLMTFDEFESAYSVVDTFPHVVHFRVGTSGGNIPELTHPFPCDGTSRERTVYNAKSVVFHNGIVSDWKELLLNLAPILKSGELKKILNRPLNDTKVVSHYVERCGANVLRLISGKWLYFSDKELMYFGNWTKEGGVYYSNKHFDRKRFFGGGKSWQGHFYSGNTYKGWSEENSNEDYYSRYYEINHWRDDDETKKKGGDK